MHLDQLLFFPAMLSNTLLPMPDPQTLLVHPLRTGNGALAEKYREILLSSEGLTTFEIFHEVSEMASRLRAKYSMRTPDALQIAVGILYGATKFLTNDPVLKRVSEIKILVLDDYLLK